MPRKQKGSRKKSGKRRKNLSNSLRSVISIFAIIVFLLLGIYGVRVIGNRYSIQHPQEKLSSSDDIEKEESKQISIGKEERLNLPAADSEKPKVVIIVDDIGFNKDSIDRLLEMGFPINFAILPYLPYSRYAAEKAKQRGWDVMLHLPMEPKGISGYVGYDAGDGVLLESLPRKDIIKKLDDNISAVPYVNGVNNHMGSKFTENPEVMEIVLRELNTKGLFFIDSKTTADSKGFEIAKTLGMKTAMRDVFLDKVSQDESYVNSQILRLVDISKKKGYAVGICHPYPETLEALTYMLPKIKGDVDVTKVSSLLN